MIMNGTYMLTTALLTNSREGEKGRGTASCSYLQLQINRGTADTVATCQHLVGEIAQPFSRPLFVKTYKVHVARSGLCGSGHACCRLWCTMRANKVLPRGSNRDSGPARLCSVTPHSLFPPPQLSVKSIQRRHRAWNVTSSRRSDSAGRSRWTRHHIGDRTYATVQMLLHISDLK